MAADIHYNDNYFAATLGCKTFNPPNSCITDAAVLAGANIQATKLEHLNPLTYQQSPGSAVVAATQLLKIIRAPGTISAIDVITTTAATGADRTVTVDLQKSTGGGAFATVLSAVVTLNNTSVAKTVYSGSISSASVVAGDILQLVVAVAGAAGAQAQGLQVTVTEKEYAQ